MATKKPAKKAAKKPATAKPKKPNPARVRKAMTDVRQLVETHKKLELDLKKIKGHIKDMNIHMWGPLFARKKSR